MVLSRLGALKRDSVLAVVRIDNASLLFDKTNTLVAQDDSDLALRVYEALARCEGDYAGWGLHRPYDVAGSEDPLNVLKHIEDFYYEASRSTFEQIYKIRSR